MTKLEKSETVMKYSEFKQWHNISRMMAIENWLKGKTDSSIFEVIMEIN